MDVEKYLKYSDARIAVNDRIVEKYMDERMIIKAGRVLGIVKGGKLIINDESNIDRVMDFGIRKFAVDGKTAVQRAFEEKLWENELEEEYLTSLQDGVDTLYEVVLADDKAKTITLREKLSKDDTLHVVNDINFSQSVTSGMLLYLCLVPVGGGYICNGGGFSFAARNTDLVLFDCNRPKNIKILKDDIKKYKFFYKLFDKMGALTFFEDVN